MTLPYDGSFCKKDFSDFVSMAEKWSVTKYYWVDMNGCFIMSFSLGYGYLILV